MRSHLFFLVLGLHAFAVVACSSEEAPPPFDGVNSGGGTGGSSGGDGSGAQAGFGGDTDGSGGASGGSSGGDGTGGEPPIGGAACGEVFCSAFAVCDMEGEPTCECAAGLEGTGLRCDDIDECAITHDICGEHASCRNTFGSYDCQCETGYEWDGEACVNIDECDVNPCHEDADCIDEEGSFECVCSGGTFGNGFFCKAVDDCASDPCGPNGTCVNALQGHACQCDFGYQGSDICTACGTDLELVDDGLRGAVNLLLGRYFNDESPIPLEALEYQTQLEAAGYFIEDLSGLECWSNLEVLDISGNPMTASGLAAVASLNQLTDLYLDCTDVSSLTPLYGHASLELLSISAIGCGTQMSDASAAGSIPQLEILNLSGHALDSVGFLSEAKHLQSLGLGGNALTDLTDLAGLGLLWGLDAGGNQLTTLDGVEMLRRLQSLSVPGNALTSLEQTSSLSGLSFLNAAENAISSLPDWSEFANLREVVVHTNEIVSLAPIAKLDQLVQVNVASNQVKTLEPLLDGVFRGTLVIGGNPLPCETEAERIQELQSLGIEFIGSCRP